MIASASFVALMPWVAAALSAVALMLSIVMLSSQARKSGRSLTLGTGSVTVLLQDADLLKTNISALRDELTTLRESVSGLSTHQAAAAEGGYEVHPEVRQFIDLVMEWQRATGLKLRGAAMEDFALIEAFTVPKPRPSSTEERRAAFESARRVVEYVVIASGMRTSTVEDKPLANLLVELTGSVKMELIEPQQGQRYDPNLHEAVDTVSAGTNQRGTIAEVVVRGLNRGKGGIMKAKVYLFD